MKNRLFLLSFCVLLSGCIHNSQHPKDVYAQSDLLPRKNKTEQSSATQSNQTQQQTLNLQGQQTPPIVVPQQTMLPSHILSNAQMQTQQTPQSNPTPFVQTIVIPQPMPYSYPNMMPMQQQVVSPAINRQQYPAQMYPTQTQQYNPTPQSVPLQPVYSDPSSVPFQNTQTVWVNPQNGQQLQADVFPKSLNVPSTPTENIPRW